MRTWIARKMLSRFEDRHAYNVDYMVEMLDRTPGAFFRFVKFMDLAQYRRDTPVAPYYAAKIVGALSEDCGPCTQLTVDMARDHGVPAAQVPNVERDVLVA